MTIDISQFHGVFFEESFEGLQVMETGLLELSAGEPDLEQVNTIFRAAHSIKGGAGSFGFAAVSEFTHLVETLLDQLRDGKRDVSSELIDDLLTSTDCMRDMLRAAQSGTECDSDRVAKIAGRLQQVLDADASEGICGNMAEPTEAGTSEGGGAWRIGFKPHEHLFRCGNDPLRLVAELHELGDAEVTCDRAALPTFGEFEPDVAYLSWIITLRGDASEDDIREVFSWVETDCNLTVERLDATEQPQEPADAVAESDAASAAENAPATPEKQAAKAAKDNAVSSIRVGIDKVDQLINMVGELVITQSMLSQISEETLGEGSEQLRDGLAQLERNTRELQESVMQIRMLPISFAFNRFPRLVRDLCGKLGKQVDLEIHGEQTELDKVVMEKIGDPLVHLVRNALDHGVETPAEREASGKEATARVTLTAFHEGGKIVIEIKDDGRGLDHDKILRKAKEKGLVADTETLTSDQVNDLIFKPGFSTAADVSDVSGRGVGMDVVRKNINALGGVVEVHSEQGVGTTFRIALPLTLAILDGQLIRVGEQIYIVPLIAIIESLQVRSDLIKRVSGRSELLHLRDHYVPLVRLYELFSVVPEATDLEEGLLVVVEADGHKVGLFVDELLSQQQVVIKSLETNYKAVKGVSGATILGDGTVALILDISGLIALAKGQNVAALDDLERAA